MTICPTCEEIIDDDELDLGSMSEILDLVAEAARSSRHAARAYELLTDIFPDELRLAAPQKLIAGRMKDVA